MKTAKSSKETPISLLKPFAFDGWGYQMPSFDVAEDRAQLAEVAGDEKLAAWWRRLMDCPEADAKRHYDACERNARDQIDALLARAEKFEGAYFPLSMLLHHLLAGLHALAAHGNQTAGRDLMSALHQAVNDFEMLATAKPQLFRERARGSIAIPGLISRNAEKQADNQRLLKQLEQGEDCKFAILPTGEKGKKWQFQDRANGLAVRLVNHITEARMLYRFHQLQAQHAGREVPGWLQDAMKFKTFSAKTWRAWAKVAWSVLAEISPNGKPGKHPAFYHPPTKICNVRKERRDPYFGKVTHAHSIAEQDIREALFGAFELIATGISRRTKQRQAAEKGSPDK